MRQKRLLSCELRDAASQSNYLEQPLQMRNAVTVTALNPLPVGHTKDCNHGRVIQCPIPGELLVDQVVALRDVAHSL